MEGASSTSFIGKGIMASGKTHQIGQTFRHHGGRRRLAAPDTILSYLLAYGQATSAELIDLLDISPGTLSRQLNAMCAAGKIHRAVKYSGRRGGHAVYAPGPEPTDEEDEEEEASMEQSVVHNYDWPRGEARRDPLVAALFGETGMRNHCVE